jgi:hypothetical protein
LDPAFAVSWFVEQRHDAHHHHRAQNRKNNHHPVGYYKEGEYLWVITRREGKWWRNLQGGAKVNLLLKRKPVQRFAEIELEEQSVAARMSEYLRHIPQAAKQMNVRMENGKPNQEDISNTAKDRLFVKIKLNA